VERTAFTVRVQRRIIFQMSKNGIASVLLVALLLIVVICWSSLKRDQGDSTPSTSEKTAPSPTPLAGALPGGVSPPPKFRVFKQSSEQSTSVVVAESTTAEQLRNLLWYFRQKVRSGDFKGIGLTVPTSVNFGKKNWDSGLIAVYKGTKCANEEYQTKGLGPCGSGDHSAATYQWGIDRVVDHDSALLTSPNGDLAVVFDYKDGWQPPPDVQARLQSERDQQQAEVGRHKVEEEIFAKELQQRVTGLGFHMDVFPGSEPDELVINSDLFDDDSGRVQFLSGVMPNWRKDLCRVGYRSVLLKNRIFSEGNGYLIGCN